MISKKLINLGDSSKAVILPADWIAYQEKKIGHFDSVVLEMQGDTVVISPEKSEEKEVVMTG